jgi:hypothetical protein
VKRDMDLIRKIVLAVEDAPTGYAPKLAFDGYDNETVSYHAYLMIQAGLATGVEVTHQRSPGPEAILTGLTWEGHEFADAARDETRWKKAMGIVQEKGGAVGFDVLKDLLSHLAKLGLGLLS